MLALGHTFRRNVLQLVKRIRKTEEWAWLAQEVFERATRKCCPELYESKFPGVTKVTINDRAYVFQKKYTKYGYLEVSLLASPSDRDSYVELWY